MNNFYKNRILILTNKQTIAKYYGINIKQLTEQHYYCYWKKCVSRYIGVFR